MLEHFYSRKELFEKNLKKFILKKKKPVQVYGLINEFISRGGKRLRPLLVLSSACAVGGKESDAMDAAIAVELFHNFTLIHDDIEDNSQLRRGLPCLHIKYGIPLSLNAGDGLFMLVWQAALNIKKQNLLAQKILLNSFSSVLEGQAIELSWYEQNIFDLSISDYLKMIGGKTASLLEGCARVGALLGGGTKKEQNALASYAYNLGLAFQIQDDILNLIGDQEKYKKEIGGDIVEGKRTLIVIDCLKKLDQTEKQKLLNILSKKSNTPDEISWAIEKFKQTNSISFAKNYAQNLVKKAVLSLKPIKNSKDKSDLIDLATYVLSREE
jgi:geranylgeranyl diphosphate synthase type I